MTFIIPCLLASVSTDTLQKNGLRWKHGNHQLICSRWLSRNNRSPCPALASIRGGDSVLPPNLNENASSLNPPDFKIQSLLLRAEELLSQKDTNGAFALLAEAYPLDPTSSKIASMFQTCMEINVSLVQDRFNKWRSANENQDFTAEELTNLFQDRMGLASLFIDREQYDEAGIQLQSAIEEASSWLNHALNESYHDHELPDLTNTPFQSWQPQIDQARYLLYRTNAACCKWSSYFQDGEKLRQSLDKTLPSGHVIRLLHPFDALKFPCVGIELASKIAESYAHRALDSVGASFGLDSKETYLQQRRVVTAVRSQNSNGSKQSQRKVRIGYLSPDFTSKHPLAFLMQHVFRFHDKTRFEIFIYSLSSENGDEGPEVNSIRESSDCFTYLSTSGKTPVQLYQRFLEDHVDIIVDLCGYAGSSIVAEIMASRCKLQQDIGSSQSNIRFPRHVAYMGFPGSMGSSKIWDYSIFDKHVVPPSLRNYYSGALVFMPHSYFVNSHKTVIGGPENGVMLANKNERRAMRLRYSIHPSAFVFCCHSRPDKIDPTTFKAWMKALHIAREEYRKSGVNDDALPVLWLLRSGNEMEQNLRSLAKNEFGSDMENALVFADIAERNEHLKRLGCADIFLDTPSYGAHTLGCDALYMGVPMISLYHSGKASNDERMKQAAISTEKLASIVGRSLLFAASCDELVVPDMNAYENLMIKCATDIKWFTKVRERLILSRSHSPLFDTDRWVKNLEVAFLMMDTVDLNDAPDIIVTEETH
eukprot:scaffold5584_cov76-Cyclotella_meneghiniana.AAC.15